MEPIVNDYNVVALSGELCIQEAAKHHRSLVSALQSGQAVHLDLAAVTACDTAGIQLLYAAGNALSARNLAFKLIDPPEAVRTAFKRAGATLPNDN